MNKPQTLDECWDACLAMWKDIHEDVTGDNNNRIKDMWLLEKGYAVIELGCFFCEWASNDDGDVDCNDCPAVEVDDEFDCFDKQYNHCYSPTAFYHKLLELNEIRK